MQYKSMSNTVRARHNSLTTPIRDIFMCLSAAFIHTCGHITSETLDICRRTPLGAVHFTPFIQSAVECDSCLEVALFLAEADAETQRADVEGQPEPEAVVKEYVGYEMPLGVVLGLIQKEWSLKD